MIVVPIGVNETGKQSKLAKVNVCRNPRMNEPCASWFEVLSIVKERENPESRAFGGAAPKFLLRSLY